MDKQTKFVYNADGVQFTIYKSVKRLKSGPRTYWLSEDFSTGKRRTLNNISRKAAEHRADKIRAALVKGQAHRLALSNAEWQDVCVAREILRSTKTGDSLISAVASWAECIAMLGDRATLLDAVKFYLVNHRGDGPRPKPISFDEAAKAYHGSKVSEGKSVSHCKNIRSRMNRLAKALPSGVMLDDLSAGQLDQEILKFGLGPKTRNEYRIMLSNFYKWAAKQNPSLVAKGFNAAKDMERYVVKQNDVEFLRVADLEKVLTGLQAKRPDLLRLVVLVCFAGLRPSEAVRLDWSEIGLDYTRLPGKKSKTGHSRQIPIQENLKLWLAQWRKDSGTVCADVSLEHINGAIRRVSGVQDIRAGKVERLIVYKLDRLGRSLPHLALILDELNRLRVPLIASSLGVDTSDDNPAGRLQLGVLMAVAEFERGIIRERVNSELAAAKARGVQLGRPSTINGRVTEIRKLKAKGFGLRAIARELKMPPSSVHKALQLAA